MFYPESNKKFELENFKNPSKYYRAAPFWAWNTRLEKDELLRQIEVLKEMGFGGFHIHSRIGMATPYLSEEFFDLVNLCNKKGIEEDMLTYLYDEDRWPSGSAGGFVTKNKNFRQTYLRFQTEPITYDRAKLVAVYDIKFNDDNTVEYKKIDKDTSAEYQKWYAYIDKEPTGNAWFNNQCYSDLLNKEANDEFFKVTHEAYKKHFKDEFKKSVMSIFTDEPQFTRKNLYDFKNDDFMMPWTNGFEKTYEKRYGEDIYNNLPEIFFEKQGDFSQTRYNYHELTADLFAENYFDRYGNWCDKNGLPMTGHVLNEQSLALQTLSVGDAMRDYLGFTMPGIDMLLNNYEFTTAKQVQSVSRQQGAEGVMSELDGVTNWDFDFRGHKAHGDWQAALGVTLRVPHLSWVSMRGEAKRDYPSTINYQAAWYKKYHIIEDYYSRVNSILTRGKADCKIAVLHPIRNIWLTLGTRDNTGKVVEKLCKDFNNLTERLVKNNVDFDFVGEGNFKKQNVHFENGKFVVGKSEYDILIIPPMLTLKSSTVEVLKGVRENNARVVAFGPSPKYMDGKKSIVPNETYRLFETKPYSIDNILDVVNEYRDLEILENDTRSFDYCHQFRIDGKDKWLFLAKAVLTNRESNSVHDITVNIKGKYVPTLYNCLNGEVYKVDYSHENEFTVINLKVFENDSIMLKLSDKEEESALDLPKISVSFDGVLPEEVDYSLTEDNVYLIDRASFKLDNGSFEETEDILKKDNELRKRLGIVMRGESVPQPWVNLNQPKPSHKITLKCEFYSKIRYKNAFLGIEGAKDCTITFNGKAVDNTPTGWFVDKCIDKISLGTIKKGKNTLIVEMPFGLTTNTENMYILGNFGVYDTVSPYIDKLPKKLKFGDISEQGLLFYGGNVDYKLGDVEFDEISVPLYKGGLLDVLSEGESIGEIIFSPYTLKLKNKKDIALRLYGTRVNTFGQLHMNARDTYGWYGPESWREYDEKWSDNYIPWVQGILTPPKTK